jgi:putative addiction module killer protein
MEARERRVERYIGANGKAPLDEWLDHLPDKAVRARIRVRLLRLGDGNLGDHRALGGRLYELRLAFGPGYRVYFGEDGIRLILLICGGDKSTQDADIRLARRCWDEFRRSSKP